MSNSTIAVSALSIAMNALLSMVKITIGMLSGSSSVTTDGLNNLSDTLIYITTLGGARMASRKPTRKHPLGFGRIEYITALIVAIIIIITALTLLKNAVTMLFTEHEIVLGKAMSLLMVISILIKLFLASKMKKAYKETGDETMRLLKVDNLLDAVSTTLALAASQAARYTAFPTDAVASIIISLLILYNGFSSIITTSSSIVGETPEQDTLDAIKAIIEKHPPLSGCFDLLIHPYVNLTVGSCTVEVPTDTPSEIIFDAMTDASLEIEKTLGISMTIGFRAVNKDIPVVADMEKKVILCLKREVPEVLSIHGFHLHFDKNLIHFEAVIDFDSDIHEVLNEKISAALEGEFPSYSFDYVLERGLD